jgi:hypothetical protein
LLKIVLLVDGKCLDKPATLVRIIFNKCGATNPATQGTTTMSITLTDLKAGKAKITVNNPAGEHVTFDVVKPKRAYSEVFYVCYNGDYIGILDPVSGVKVTKNSKAYRHGKIAAIIGWSIRQVAKGKTPPQGYAIRGSGHCLRCGRVLTNPDSLDALYGPECRGKINESTPVKG